MNRSILPVVLALAGVLSAAAQPIGSKSANVTLAVGANPVPGNVPVTATVQPGSGSTKIPTGTITFLDGTMVLNPGGSGLTASSVIKSQTFAAAIGAMDPGLASVATGMVTGDFDGDGKPDLLVYGPGSPNTSTLVQVFLTGNAGSAPFRVAAVQTIAATLSNYLTPTALDVNGDGKLDVLIGNRVAYGNGDGTFQAAKVVPFLANGFRQTYAVNVTGGDGPDIVAVDAPPSPIPNNATVQFAFTVFKNDGSGTFTSLGNFALAAPIQTGNMTVSELNIFSLSFGDVNGDGKLDVLSQSNATYLGLPAALVNDNVMLNNGDGSFGAPKPLDTSSLNSVQPAAAAFGDVNGDGKADLALTYSDSNDRNYFAAALGNGDGTFGSFTPLLLINYITAAIPNPQVQLADVNGDGNLDVITGSGEAALGKGDGTFTLGTPLFAQPAQPQTPLNYPLVQMPIGADAAQSLVYLNTTSGANAVFTPQNAAMAQTTLSLAAGTHAVTAEYSGDGTYAAVTSQPVTVTVGQATTTLTLGVSNSAPAAGQNVILTATIAGLAPGGGGTVSFSNGSTTLGTATVSNGSASFTTSFASPGTQTITAAYSGDASDAASTATVAVSVASPVTVGSAGGGSTSLTVASGQSVTTQVSIAGKGGFTGAVALSCTGLPTNAACSFSPASVTLSGAAAASSTLTVSTSGGTATASADSESLHSATVFACALPAMGLVLLLPMARGRRIFLCVGFLLFAGLAGISGCGGGSSHQTPAGSYTFQVVATSGSNTASSTYQLTVQ